MRCISMNSTGLLITSATESNDLYWMAIYIDTLKPVTYGVPQDSILSPFLFTLFENELPNTMGKSTVCQYANDTTIYASYKDPAAIYVS